MKSTVEIGIGRTDGTGESRENTTDFRICCQKGQFGHKKYPPKQTKSFFLINLREQAALPHTHTEKHGSMGKKTNVIQKTGTQTFSLNLQN